MNLQEKIEEQAIDSDKPYNILDSLNIYFEGLLTIDSNNKDESVRQYLNEYLSKGTEYIECQKTDNIGIIWQIRCKSDSKQDAIDSIKDYLLIILKQENINFLNIGISISLSFFSHKNIDRPLSDPIDYSLFENSLLKFSDVSPKLFEPVEPYFAKWDGKEWSEKR